MRDETPEVFTGQVQPSRNHNPKLKMGISDEKLLTGAGLDSVLELHNHYRHVVAAVALLAVGPHWPRRRLHLLVVV